MIHKQQQQQQHNNHHHRHTTLMPGSIVHDEIQIIKTLGVGAYGKVYLGQDLKTKQRYAVKALQQRQLDDHQRALQRNEMILHSKLIHPNVIRLERIIKHNECVHMVLEHCAEGDLFSAITERNLYHGNHALIRQVFLQLIDAVQYCHQQHVYHRDLKPENILVFDNGRTLKIADFGLATSQAIAKDFGCGSTFYFSPECQGDDVHLSNGYATAPNDIWSLGVILVNLAASRNPWRQACLDDDTFRAYLADRDYLLKVLPISRELNGIIKRIFCIDPKRRISLEELRESILHCKYFTRTSQVERAETNTSCKLQNIFPLTPPTTPGEAANERLAGGFFPPTPGSCSSFISSSEHDNGGHELATPAASNSSCQDHCVSKLATCSSQRLDIRSTSLWKALQQQHQQSPMPLSTSPSPPISP
ncbi:protein serine threonine kinase [Lichtheimia corymbifera JMRC:FSU:9682]|uniref:Protein serine threonine kinase n=1 Tax=Lichtheimia corymbifera JMRC:FSU:9682 TaxID=1263082 RepID=A0A068RUA9_9FUNG|nr:protein serine threonine kinase [Lichtheimia corymbifera JMRC:FSU:9682]